MTESDIATASAPTLGVFGLFGSANFGNEATLAAFLHHVRARLPGVRFVAIATPQSRVEPMYGMPRMDMDPLRVDRYFWRLRSPRLRRASVDLAERLTEPARHRRAVQGLAAMDALVMPGTGLIDDFGQRPQDMPTHLSRWTRAAARRGIPVSFLSVGVSTVSNPASRALFLQTLGRADFCSFRDQKSATNARGLGYDAAAQVYPDLAFSLPASVVGRAGQRGARPVVGVGVMGYFGWNQTDEDGRAIYRSYLDRLCRLVQGLIDEGCDVRLLTGDARADTATVADVMAQVGCQERMLNHLHAPAIENFNDVIAELGRVDVVVASRFHNVLLALMLERPVVSIGYSDKNDAVMGDFGLSRFCHGIETFDTQSVLEQVRQLLVHPEQASGELRCRLDMARTRLDELYDTFCARLVSD